MEPFKNSTVLVNYYSSIKEMNKDLKAFLFFYILYRAYGSIKKELRVKTPMEALENWYKLKPELFTQTPQEFIDKILILQQENKQ